MAPEVLGLGSQASTTSVNYPAADMWALGVMTFRTLIRVAPFSSVVDILQYRDNPDLSLPHARLENCGISPDGAAFIRALLRPLPDERLKSNKALYHDWIRSDMSSALVLPAAPSE
jgi:serine/threonine protein kinase